MYRLWHTQEQQFRDAGRSKTKGPLVFFRTGSGAEPVRDWLKTLAAPDRQQMGRDLMRAQWRWPVGMPLCRPLGEGLWQSRTDLPSKSTARVMIGLYRERLVALHGFIKKTRTTPDADLRIARKRRKEMAK